MKKNILSLFVILGVLWLDISAQVNASEDERNDRFLEWTDEDYRSYEDSIYSALYSPVTLEHNDSINADPSGGIPGDVPGDEPSISPDSKVNSYVPTSIAVDTSKAVGEIPITSGVASSGAKTYEVPIDVPPGMNGMTPSLFLSYNSHQGNSIAGKGWTIGGLSAITRTSASRYYRAMSMGVRMWISDEFLLDGMHLVLYPQNDSFLDYRAYETEQGSIMVKLVMKDGTGPKYFEAYFPNGCKGIYGFTNNTVPQLSYPLTSLTDPNGNTINYTYTFENNSYRVKSVSYNGASIDFTYETRPDKVTTFSGGVKVVEGNRLSKITCKLGANVLKAYTLSYTSHNSTSLLSQIGCSAGGKSLNPIRLYYGEGNTSSSFSNSDTQLVTWWKYSDPGMVRATRGKFDYSIGKDGLIVHPNYNPYWHYYRYMAPGAGNAAMCRFENKFPQDTKILLYTGLDTDYVDIMPNLTTEAGFIDILCADLDGTQEDNIIKINNVVDGENDKVTFQVYRASVYNGLVRRFTRTYSFPTVLTDDAGAKSVHPKFYYTGDFNGDGRMEVMAISANDPLNVNRYTSIANKHPSRYYIFDLVNDRILEQGEIFKYNVEFVGMRQPDARAAANNSDRVLAFDYDGDGVTDICHIHDGGSDIYSWTGGGITVHYDGIKRADLIDRDLLLGDFNGDGLVDMLVSPKSGGDITWALHCSKGNGSFEKTTFSLCKKSSDKNAGFMTQDVNGDGRTDLISYGLSDFKTYICTGGTFSLTPVSASYNSSKSLLVPVNVNSHNTFAQLLSLKDDKATKYGFSRNDATETLSTGMANSLGVIERTTYGMLNSDAGMSYTPGWDAVFPFVNLQEDIPVAVMTETLLKGSLIDKESYHYEKAVYHRQGRGFMGFKTITTVNSRNQILTRTYDPYSHSQLISEKSPTRESTYTYSVSGGGWDPARVLLTKKVEKDLLKNVSATTVYENDSCGYPVKESITYSGGIRSVKTTTYKHKADFGAGYHLGVPVYEGWVHSNASGSHTETITSQLNSILQPQIRYYYVNGGYAKKELIAYDSHGNIIKKVEVPYSSSSGIAEEYVYDTAGRITKTTDKFGLSKEYSYNPLGRIISIKDHRGNSTSFTYDSFGRESLVKYPEGVDETTAYAWTSECDRAVYAISRKSTKAPTEKEVYDAFNREIRHCDTRFDGTIRKIDLVYNTRGLKLKESMPFTSSAASLWNTYSYDSYDRLLSITEASGRKTTQSYNGCSISTTENGITTKRTYDALDNLTEVSDPSGKVEFILASDGQPVKITAPGNAVTSFEYDKFRRRTSMSEPGSGKTTYHYDESGNISKEINANGDSIVYTYDAMLRLSKKKSKEFSTTYTYNSNNELTGVNSTNGTSRSITYDTYGRVKTVKESASLQTWYKREFTYTSGNITSIKHTSNKGTILTERHAYSNGTLSEVFADSTSVFKYSKENSLGKLIEAKSGVLTRYYGYSQYGYPSVRRVQCGSNVIQNLSYNFDLKTSSLLSRNDHKNGKSETFAYDNLNRLTSFGGKTVSYDNKGNITSLSDVGSMQYNVAGKPYAVSDVIQAGALIPLRKQQVTYTSFSRPSRIIENATVATFTYNGDHERVGMSVTKNGNAALSRIYLGGCYEQEQVASVFTERVYLYGGYYDSPAVYVKTKGFGRIEYILRDHLGSITDVVSSAGQVNQSIGYDAWGRMRNPSTGVLYTPETMPELRLGRGYTGHEFLPWFGLVNMNARLYDPAIGRFLSPDPFVQAPDMPQNFNRYSYCLNNPLIYNDPDGEFVNSIITGIVDLFTNLFKHGFNVSQYSWKRTENAWKIDMAMFKGNIGQIISKWTYGLINSMVGNLVSHGYNILGKVDGVTYLDGMAALSGATSGEKAVTIGHYSLGPKGYKADWRDHLFVHEYGHYIQSQRWGPLFLNVIGIPSLLSAMGTSKSSGTIHDYRWFEIDASYLGAKHFDKKYGSGKQGYRPNSADYFDINAFRKYGYDSPYQNPRTGEYNYDNHPTRKPDDKPKFYFWDLVL